MNDATALQIASGDIDANEKDCHAAWQHLIDTGLAWSHPDAFYSRTAKGLIRSHKCCGSDIKRRIKTSTGKS